MAYPDRRTVYVSCGAGAQDLGSLIGNDKYNDFILECGGRRWPFHQVIVCSQSRYFTTACDKKWAEGQDTLLVLKEDDPMTVHAMMEFFYIGDYIIPADRKHTHDANYKFKTTFDPRQSETFVRETNFHFDVWKIADKYGITKLANRALKRVDEHIDLGSMPATISPDVVRAVYSSDVPTASELRERLAQTVELHIPTIFFSQKEETRKWIDEPGCSEFILDCLHYANTRVTYRGPHVYACPDCRTEFVAEMFTTTMNRYYCPRCGTRRTETEWEPYKMAEVTAYPAINEHDN